MGTPAGVFAFLRSDVNECFKNMLDEYKIYLESAASQAVLNTGAEGWFSEQALSVMGSVASQGYGPITFDQAYVCNPSLPAYGFGSWDQFFIRTFRDGVRPVASPTDSNVIVSACESGPYALETNVQKRDRFWIKGQPYSLLDMLNFDGITDYFVGGTVYQAFLSALSYHRWHSPIDGTISKVVHIPGTYYAENYWEGFANIDPVTGEPAPDPAAPNDSQGYICEVAARALIFIIADDKRIGTVGIVEVGMAEVSSCEVTVVEGQHVKKGDQIGMVGYFSPPTSGVLRHVI
jgi:phosphatidylserine decarboxylase